MRIKRIFFAFDGWGRFDGFIGVFIGEISAVYAHAKAGKRFIGPIHFDVEVSGSVIDIGTDGAENGNMQEARAEESDESNDDFFAFFYGRFGKDGDVSPGRRR